MSNKPNVEVNIYNTPEKRPMPDQKNKTHIQSTIPSVFQHSFERQDQFKSPSFTNKQTCDAGNSYYISSEKRVSKNQWELKQKIDQYETQIRLLRQYLRQSTCNSQERSSISRIFGFEDEKSSAYNEQQKVIKELGYKVKSLIKQNNKLKHSQVSYNKLNINEIIRENQNLKRLLDQYKSSQAVTSQKLILQNRVLRADIKKIGFQYDQKLRLIEVQYARKLAQKEVDQSHLKQKLNFEQLRISNNFVRQLQQKQTAQLTKIHQIEQNYRYSLQQNDKKWKIKLKDLQKHYSSIKFSEEDKVKQLYLKKKNEQICQLRSNYEQLIISIQNSQDKKLSTINAEIEQLEKRLHHANQSLSHFKFERQNRLTNSIKKSKNFAQLSPLLKGDDIQPQISNEQKITPISNIRSSFEIKQQRSSYNTHNLVLQQKIEYLTKQLQQFSLRERLTQKMLAQKNQRILTMENQLRQAYLSSQALKSSINRPQVVTIQRTQVPKNYVQQIKNIKQSILSCNLSNFDTFENQFKQIVMQRDQMNEKLSKIKQGAKQSSKSFTLQKHLKVERQKNRQLEQNLKKYEKQIESLQIQVIQLQDQLQKIQFQQIAHDVESANIQRTVFSDGKSALEWQKVMRHCLLTSINRLQNLQNCMKADIKKNQ